MVSWSRPRTSLLSSVLAVVASASVLVAADNAGVSGTFKGNGKEAKLRYVTVRKGEEFDGKPTYVIVLSEKDTVKDKKPDIRAGFGDYGSALVATVLPDGKIVGFEVVHSAHKKGALNSIGTVKMSDFKLADGRIQGKMATDGEVKTFGQSWEVNVAFNTKMP